MKTNYPISSILHHKNSAVWTVAPTALVFDALKFMAEKNIGALLVVSGGKLLGLFTERDYARKVALQGKTSRTTTVLEILEPCVTISPDDSVEDSMRLMIDRRVRHLPVLENGDLIGIVSIGDLVNWIISAQDAVIEQMEQYIAGGVTV